MKNLNVALTVTLLLVSALSLYFLFSPICEGISSIYKIKIGYVEYVNVTVLVDNNPYSDLISPWGISLYLEAEDLRILFDTGPSSEALRINAERLGINLRLLDFIVISHEHGDHVLGLEYIAELNRNLTVYVPKHMSVSCKVWIKNLGFKVLEMDATGVIDEGVAIIGELYGPPYEQALAVNVKGIGLIILVGCSHPGVDKIVVKAADDLNCEPYAVIGGFHLSGASREKMKSIAKNLMESGLKKVYPIHCSGEGFRRLFEEEYHEAYGDGHVGLMLSFSEVRASKPAEFEISNLSIAPSEAQTGETVTISVELKNTGESEGSYNLTLKVNGAIEDEKTITLAGGESRIVEFKVAKDSAGTYNIEISGLTRTLKVKEAHAQPIENFLLYIAITITAAIIIVAIAISKRKK